MAIANSSRTVKTNLRDDNLAPKAILALLREGTFLADADAVAHPCAEAFTAAVAAGPVTLQSELVALRSWRRWLVAEQKKLERRHGHARARLEELARASEAARRFVEESRIVKDVLTVTSGERRIIGRAIEHTEKMWSEMLIGADGGPGAWTPRQERMQPVTTAEGLQRCAFVSGGGPPVNEAEEKSGGGSTWVHPSEE